MELIIGAGVSLLVQVLKKWSGASGTLALALVLAISVAAAMVYTVLVDAGLWDAVVRVLTAAGAFYSFVLLRFEK